MKAIKNTSTIDLLGLTPTQGYILAALIGKTIGHRFTHQEYLALGDIFPLAYQDLDYVPNIDLTKMDEQSLQKALIDAGFAKRPVTIKPQASVGRRADGRFKSKKWVARFSYMGEKDWNAEGREVVTEYPGKGKKPNLRIERDSRYIRGYDTGRAAYRQFKVANITSEVKWSREYVD